MHYRHWVRRNRGKNLKYGFMLKSSGVKVNLYVIWKISCENALPITIALGLEQERRPSGGFMTAILFSSPS
jgi:hypothetical protein